MSQWNSPFDDSFTEPVRVLSVCIRGVEVRAGVRVRIWPRKSADIMDLALRGKTATVEAIESDYDNNIHVAVVLEDDPGRELGMQRQPGHRFFFGPEELEPLAASADLGEHDGR
jgi:hypothetical protein